MPTFVSSRWKPSSQLVSFSRSYCSHHKLGTFCFAPAFWFASVWSWLVNTSYCRVIICLHFSSPDFVVLGSPVCPELVFVHENAQCHCSSPQRLLNPPFFPHGWALLARIHSFYLVLPRLRSHLVLQDQCNAVCIVL